MANLLKGGEDDLQSGSASLFLTPSSLLSMSSSSEPTTIDTSTTSTSTSSSSSASSSSSSSSKSTADLDYQKRTPPPIPAASVVPNMMTSHQMTSHHLNHYHQHQQAAFYPIDHKLTDQASQIYSNSSVYSYSTPPPPPPPQPSLSQTQASFYGMPILSSSPSTNQLSNSNQNKFASYTNPYQHSSHHFQPSQFNQANYYSTQPATTTTTSQQFDQLSAYSTTNPYHHVYTSHHNPGIMQSSTNQWNNNI